MAMGILLSRLSGLIRESIFASYFGNSTAGDAFKAALKIPNFLQNLFGEGVLSASFIPVYAELLAQDKHEDSQKVASSIATVLALLTSILVLIGVLITPLLIDIIAPGFTGSKRLLTIHLVQIFFPGTGLLVMSAWCLGVLNSHRKFFLPYFAPVLWNVAIIATLVFFGPHEVQDDLAVTAAWGLVVGSALQFLVQIPTVLKLIKGLKPGLNFKWSPVQMVMRNFGPVVVSRGVVQVSAYIDSVLASFLPTGSVSALAYAQTIYLLPVSLFGMSVSAAELPAMSSLKGSFSEIALMLSEKLNRGLEQIAFFIIPSVAGFLFLGDVIVAALFQRGAFDGSSTRFVWTVLVGSTIGLFATTQGRLYSSAFYALKDTKTPLRYAIVRVLLTTILGYVMGLKIPGWLSWPAQWGTVGLTASAGLAGWIEFFLLRRGLNKKLQLSTGLPLKSFFKLWLAALVASAVSFSIKYYLLPAGVLPSTVARAVLILGLFAVIYFVLTWRMGFTHAQKIFKKLKLVA